MQDVKAVTVAWTYLVECSDGSLYAGSTIDLERRMRQHNEGEGAAYTRRRRPVKLVWSHYSLRIKDAFAFEKQLQNWGRKKRLALIEGRFDDLSVLASRGHNERRAATALPAVRTDAAESESGGPSVS